MSIELRIKTPPCVVGDRIRLLHMPNDPCPIPAGTTGTVTAIVDLSFVHKKPDAQIQVKWDINRSISLIWPLDSFEVIQ